MQQNSGTSQRFSEDRIYLMSALVENTVKMEDKIFKRIKAIQIA